MESSPDTLAVYSKVSPDVAYDYVIKGPNEDTYRNVSDQQLVEEANRLCNLV